tara:strand:- start:9402 stop:9752 length:351 start_codon:yes stop_codon:yes gene_type:complete
MEVNSDWIERLRKVYPELEVLKEGGFSYIFIKDLILPDGVIPEKLDALLCIDRRDGYDSRLYVSEKIKECDPSRNWNGNIVLMDKNWFAVSWKTQQGLTYIEMLMVHLKAFEKWEK